MFAENILVSCEYYDLIDVNRYSDDGTIYPNNYEHSRIRACLNGLSYKFRGSNAAGKIYLPVITYSGKGFLQMAFTEEEQGLIAEITVDNTALSTNPDTSLWNNGFNTYACSDTKDKVFLLSEQEKSKYDVGRIEMTDFAKASGCGGNWWLRSPVYYNCNYARYVYTSGYFTGESYVNSTNFGVVPALCLD